MIEVKNLSKTFQIKNGTEIKALDNISFKAEDGEIVGIIGMSGSGKSTLLRILRGVESFDHGEIIVDDIKLSPDSTPYYFTKLKKATAIHLQRSFGLWSETALQNVLRKLNGTKYGDEALTDFDNAFDEFGEEALEILNVVGLGNKKDHFAPVLSGGEKQRLIMARQLAKKPKILLLDEPATMSCPKTKQEILDAIKNINKKLGVTVILVSHLPEVHEYLADKLILMEKGKIIDEGNPKEIVGEFLKDIDSKYENVDDSKLGKPVIKVENLNRKFFLLKGGNVLQMENINFEINKGEISSIIGPSGSGKTVLLRMIAGLDFPDSGEVYFKLDGEWINMHEPGLLRMALRRKLGFMHQEFSLVHHSTVKEQIASRLGVKGENVIGEARKKAEEMGISDIILDVLYQLTDLPENEAKFRLENIGLDPEILHELFPSFPEKAVKEYAKPIFEALDLPLEILDRKSYELSGGQKVRATLALVLTSNPEVLILDEPFGDLDPLTLRNVSNALKKINKEFNTTIIMVSHHVDFIEEVSTRAIMIRDGELVMDGKPGKLCNEFIKISEAKYLKKRPLKTE
ncbi:MAG: ABC transporter ATP-binding protein [Methanobacteriaceae archaeon]|jgi:methyl coenzyme M reductase system subunit A2|nr:MAG: ABC transporter ATP-binding protein [Methanobacterium sp. BRmetb2]MCC7558309.1 ABC transporter ATP-binding protein [Methanobacteriaceae archaeon]